MDNSIPPTFLDPTDRALMVRLIDTVDALSKRIEERLPAALKSKHWQQNFHDPNPWATLYWRFVTPAPDATLTLTPLELEALSLRATLSQVSLELRTVFEQGTASVKPEPDLSLKKHKRINY